MNQRRLGNSELQVSEIGLGCNNFGFVKALDVNETRRIVHRAFDCGINFLDTSDSYGHSEEFLGQVLGSHRSRVVLATKFGSQLDTEGKKKGASQRYIFSAVEASLSRLKTDWIDLYQLHRPDPDTPIEETLRALTLWCNKEKSAASDAQIFRQNNCSKRTRPQSVSDSNSLSPARTSTACWFGTSKPNCSQPSRNSE